MAPAAPLVNITFFLGAGFSKAWDARYPTGNQLFSVPGAKRDSLSDVERASSFSGPIIPADRTLTISGRWCIPST